MNRRDAETQRGAKRTNFLPPRLCVSAVKMTGSSGNWPTPHFPLVASRIPVDWKPRGNITKCVAVVSLPSYLETALTQLVHNAMPFAAATFRGACQFQ